MERPSSPKAMRISRIKIPKKQTKNSKMVNPCHPLHCNNCNSHDSSDALVAFKVGLQGFQLTKTSNGVMRAHLVGGDMNETLSLFPAATKFSS